MVPAISYVRAAEELAAELRVGTILIVTTDPRAILHVKDIIANSTQYRYLFPKKIVSSSDGLEYVSDLYLLSMGAGAIVTFSSNMGRLVRYLRHLDIARKTFKIRSLDQSTFDPTKL
eukprot:CAMPEP_0197285290 /NCGR_PEP_ID=MMETSP0890-20130614/511_1 /TAXON_ID=44058 ORGANISM="Aureoumbra lagunensis, Strain CCMP1510" /NCGR_SAMPLE_ID=MMETSP0890 /ASSEMBLY_ACC=CAM_ASM_000533 /LENGTH=116 /DNA_ID=CAMNT_0042752639 /DNA_START=725 /DNA_END=1075 /DNA_ORIENTATION=+